MITCQRIKSVPEKVATTHGTVGERPTPLPRRQTVRPAMDASKNTPQQGNKPTTGTVLGEQSGIEVTTETDDVGTTQGIVDPGDAVIGSIEHPSIDSHEANISVDGVHYDDEEGHVELRVDVAGTLVRLSQSPTRAHRLAEELRLAALVVDEGGQRDETAYTLSELIDRHQRTDWSSVPCISVSEAGVWTQRLDRAKGEIEGGEQ